MSEKLNEAFKEIYKSLNDEQKEKARECRTEAAFIEFAGEQGIELPAEVLDEVSGGYIHRQLDETKVKCKRCGAIKKAYELEFGYCGNCLKEMYAAHVTPLI